MCVPSIRYFVILFGLFTLTLCNKNYSVTIEEIARNGIGFGHILRAVNGKNSNVSLNCAAQMSAIQYSDVRFKMADAWSKFPFSGIGRASRADYGNYDECISIELDAPTGKILGKHCAFGFIIPDLGTAIFNPKDLIAKSWKLSYCVPHGCTAQDLLEAIGIPPQLPIFNDMACSTKETYSEIDTGAIVTLAVFGIIILLSLGSTLHDVYLFYNQKKNTNSISIAFSWLNNGRRLLSTVKKSKEQILCFHGIKFIGMWWIIAGHGAAIYSAVPITNSKFVADFPNKLSGFYIMCARLAVDSFFYISGFLLSYLYFKNKISKKPFWAQVKLVPSMVLHRYLRLTPAVLMMFLFLVYLAKYLGSGPAFHYTLESVTSPCKEYWWAVFGYFQNYYVYSKTQGLCMTTLWYISADMELFLVSPFVVIPVAVLYNKSFKKAMIALVGLNVFFVVLPIFTKLYWKSYDPQLDEYDAHSRLTNYFIGVTMGLYMRHIKQKYFKFREGTNVCIWALTLITMMSVVLMTQITNMHFGYVGKTMSLSFTRPIWCLCLCWITYACVSEQGGVINWCLSNSFMQFGGALTYCLYLTHGSVVAAFGMANKDKKYINHYFVFYMWCGHFIISMILSIFWTLSFEMPMITFQKMLLRRGGGASAANKNEQPSTEHQRTE